jgi:hypothetical protein
MEPVNKLSQVTRRNQVMIKLAHFNPCLVLRKIVLVLSILILNPWRALADHIDPTDIVAASFEDLGPRISKHTSHPLGQSITYKWHLEESGEAVIPVYYTLKLLQLFANEQQILMWTIKEAGANFLLIRPKTGTVERIAVLARALLITLTSLHWEGRYGLEQSY